MSEAKERGKWVLASDFPFTRETLGSYEKKAFFDSNNDDMLVKLIIDFKKVTSKKISLMQISFIVMKMY